MKRSLAGWQVAGFLFVSVTGTLLHFLYEWSGENRIAGLFSAVNESIWEHMKLIYFPMFLFALIQRKFVDDSRYWCIKLAGTMTALLLILVLYYTYTGALGISADWFNITIFFLAAGAAYFLETKGFRSSLSCGIPSGIAIVSFLLVGLLFAVFTFYPLQIPLFADPRTGMYGIQ